MIGLSSICNREVSTENSKDRKESPRDKVPKDRSTVTLGLKYYDKLQVILCQGSSI